jgi:ATP-dependent DNA helicase HFM1/MER3
VEVVLEIKCGLSVELQKPQQKKGKLRAYEMTSILTVTSDNTFVDYRRIPWVPSRGLALTQTLMHSLRRTHSLKDAKVFTVFAELTKPSQSVVTVISSVRLDFAYFCLVVDLL